MSDDESISSTSTREIRRRKVSIGDFNDIHPNIDKNDDDPDDIEKQIDNDNDDEFDEKSRNELLFAVQGLGSTKKMNGIDFYMKGPHCEDSLIDIIKLCKKHDESLAVKLELGKWEVLQKDLIQLLVSQTQDKKLTFYLLILMTQLTEVPPEKTERREQLFEYLQVNFLLE